MLSLIKTRTTPPKQAMQQTKQAGLAQPNENLITVAESY